MDASSSHLWTTLADSSFANFSLTREEYFQPTEKRRIPIQHPRAGWSCSFFGRE